MFRKNLEKVGVCTHWPPCLELAVNGQLESLGLLHLRRRRQGLKIRAPLWRPLNLVVFLQRYVFLAYPVSTFWAFFHLEAKMSLGSVWALLWPGLCPMCLCPGGAGYPDPADQEPEAGRDAGPAPGYWRWTAGAHWEAGASAGHRWCFSADHQPILESGW